MAGRLSSSFKSKGLSCRINTNRKFSGPIVGGTRAWRNETQEGSSTEVFVYKPESQVTWPDHKLGVLGVKDPNFRLPGNTGISLTGEFPESNPNNSDKKFKADIFTEPTNKESQVHALYSASDYIKYTPGSEGSVCVDLLDEYPRIIEMQNIEISVHDTPMLLRKEMASLFPGQNIESGTFTTITYSQHTELDMSTWSDQVEEEREAKMETFVQVAKEICGRLKEEGYFADFIDPCSGTPYYGSHTNTTMFETDEKFRALGFRIEDLGCCKVISHPQFGRNVFVGTIMTNAKKDSIVIDEIFEDMF